MAALLYGGAVIAAASPTTSIFAPMSTPAHDVNDLSIFVLAITGFIYVGVSGLLVYALVRFRARPGDTTEPPQVFGSVQIELSWTIIPILIIVVLFLSTARVLFSRAGCTKAGDGGGCDRRRPPVLVGVSLSAVQRGDSE